MTTSMERMQTRPHEAGEQAADRRAIGPEPRQNVPEGPATHAMRGVLWSVTVARMVLVPVFLVGAFRLQALALQGVEAARLRWGLVLALGVIAASDMLDGWIARRFGLASQQGAIADALADKLAQVALVAFFTFSRGPAFASLPVGFFALVLGRDLVLGGGWLALQARTVPFRVVHRIHGRAATVGVFAMLFWLTAGVEADGFAALMLLTAALIWVSTGAYVADAYMTVRHGIASTPNRSEGGEA